MIVLGTTGAVAAVFALYAVMGRDGFGAIGSSPTRFVLIHACALLMARSILHAIAGAKVMGGREPDTDKALARYVTFGLVASFLVGGALVLVHFLQRYEGARTHTPPSVYTSEACMVVLLMLCWPFILRGYSTAWRARSDRRPDCGLASLGWLLLVLGVLQLALAVARPLYGLEPWSAEPDWPPGVSIYHLTEIVAGPRWPWWAAGIGVVQLWAAIELIRATGRQRLAATIYGGFSTAVTMYLIWPQLQQLDSMIGDGLVAVSMVNRLFEFAFWLVVPLVTMILANRKPSATPSPARPSISEDLP